MPIILHKTEHFFLKKMIEIACYFYKVVQNIHIPLARNNPSIPFEARFKFLRDLATQ
jgi:hypothetical protein